jgi:hypothetical protein
LKVSLSSDGWTPGTGMMSSALSVARSEDVGGSGTESVISPGESVVCGVTTTDSGAGRIALNSIVVSVRLV